MSFRTLIRLALISLCCVSLSACWIRLLSGPTTIELGEHAVFQIQAGVDNPNVEPKPVFLIVELPEPWDVVEVAYTGTVAGVPVEGLAAPSVSPPPLTCDAVHLLPDGFQRLWFEIPNDEWADGDSVIFSPEVVANTLPDGPIPLYFWIFSHYCAGSAPQRALLNGAPSVFGVRQIVEGASPAGTVSPLGEHFYESREDHWDIWDRDPVTGELSGEREEGLLHPEPEQFVFSDDGQKMYAIVEETILIYERNLLDGSLELLDSVDLPEIPLTSGGPLANRLTIPPESEHLYATHMTGGAIFVYQIEEDHGLQLLHEYLDIFGPAIAGPRTIAWSSDAQFAYVPLSYIDTIGIFERDPATGEMTHVQDVVDGVDGVTGLDWVEEVALSPDETVLLGKVGSGETLTEFGRDPLSGQLEFRQALTVEDLGLHSFGAVYSLGFLSDGRAVIGTARGVFFLGSSGTGHLELVGSHYRYERGLVLHGTLQVDSAIDAAYSRGPGNKLYVLRTEPDLFSDGFESGNLLAWGTQNP